MVKSSCPGARFCMGSYSRFAIVLRIHILPEYQLKLAWNTPKSWTAMWLNAVMINTNKYFEL